MSDTTAMIDVTATMLPRTVMNDRSLALQIASSAIAADSRNVFMPGGLLLSGVVHLHRIAVGHAADRVVRPDDDLIPFLQAGQHLEVLLAGDAHLDRHE